MATLHRTIVRPIITERTCAACRTAASTRSKWRLDTTSS